MSDTFVGIYLGDYHTLKESKKWKQNTSSWHKTTTTHSL